MTTNIRELEGALTRVVAFSSLTGRPMTVELAEDVLKDVFPQGQSVEISIRRIQETVSERFGMTVNELCSAKRSQSIAYPRQVAMYLSARSRTRRCRRSARSSAAAITPP